MEGEGPAPTRMTPPSVRAAEPAVGSQEAGTDGFRARFVGLFESDFSRLFRYLDRLSGDPDLAADLAQQAFVRLFSRGAMPDAPGAWLVSVAMNLFRNERSTSARRKRLLAGGVATEVQAAPPPLPGRVAEEEETRARVRRVLDHLPERDRSLLLLRAEGYSYHEIATTLGLHEASVGTLLARSRREFRRMYEEGTDAP